MFEEKRKHQRYEFSIEVKYWIKRFESQTMKKLHPEVCRTASTRDISMGGLQIIDNSPVEPGEILRIKFCNSDTDKCDVFAKVRWCKLDEGINKYRMGLEFMYLKNEVLNVIKSVAMN